MAIDRLINTERRMRVAWLGADPPPEGRRAFEERGYAVDRCSSENLASLSFLAGVGAVVFTQDKAKLRKIKDELNQHAFELLDADCHIVICPAVLPGTDTLSIITETIKKLR